MTSPARLLVAAFVWSLLAPFSVVAHAAALQVATPAPAPATALEVALVEHVCRTTGPPGAAGIDVHQACYDAQLLSLRADFGRDLSRLSAAQRRTLDSVCAKLREESRREDYLGCLNAQLTSIRSKRPRGNPPPPAEAAVPSPLPGDPALAPAPPAQQASRSAALWIGAGLAVAALGAGGVFLAMKRRPPLHKCRVCGKDLTGAGDLCPTCRHEAAESLKRAATERADQQRAEEEKQLRQSDQEEQRRQRARLEEEARLQQEANARQQQQEEARQRELEEASQRSQTADAAEEIFDPYAVLGVPRGASREDIGAAYEAAKLKYDVDQLAHLSNELQDHFRAKAQAVERAYQLLTEST